ncbi:hypothetical protein PInf_014564 [Phytophthora infestans]|nr:hypothetical protein PInf_014564 [Phytophthora infestans]
MVVTASAVPSTQQARSTEQVRGIQSGEVFVRLNGVKLCEPHGTLHGARPFLVKLLHLDDDKKEATQRLIQPSEDKLAFTRKMRRHTRQRRRTAKERWDAVRGVIEVYDNENVCAVANHLVPIENPASSALDRYFRHFQTLEQAYKQHVTSDILHLYALLEAESKYITAWNKCEEAKYNDQRALTKLLFRFNSFALQLESETSGQVRMWRLPVSDPQRKRCVKAATENIKKRFFSSPGQPLEVLEVYKIDNRVLLSNFQRFTDSLSKTNSDIKIKGLFCNLPADSVKRCVVYGMHTAKEKNGEIRFLDPHGAEIKVFSRSALLHDRKDAPGTSMAFRARLKVNNGTELQFPRRFSRYSTLEELRTTVTGTASGDQVPAVQYLGLCRVAMSKILRVKNSADSNFPEDPSVGALHFTNEQEEEASRDEERVYTPPETVLANCAQQRTQLREDLQRLERLFWSRAREIWEEEGIRSGVKILLDCRPHTSETLQARTQELRGELDRLNQMEDELARKTVHLQQRPRSRRR